MTRHTAAERGFTLLEALIAGAVFFISVVAISLLTVQGNNNAGKGMRQAQASRVATQELERWSMRGYVGVQSFLDGGAAAPTPYAVPAYTIAEQPDGGGRQYTVNVSISDSSPVGGAPTNLGVPSYFLQILVTSTIPGSPTPVSIVQSTYVSPSS